MSIAHLVRQIRALPYNDMMMVANEIRARIGELTNQQIEAVVLADILARLAPGDVATSMATQEEEKVLREIFRVKRTITVQRHEKGWHVDIPTLPAGSIYNTELRSAVPLLLDQIITMHVLSKK